MHRFTNNKEPRLIRVTDRVYSSTGYGLSNVLYVITDSTVVIIDTTESVACARTSLADFRNMCELPISYIIFTHHHSDHIRGAKAFRLANTNVIAHVQLENELAKKALLARYRLRADIVQFGLSLPAFQRGVTHRAEYGLSGGDVASQPIEKAILIPPDITFDKEYRFREGETEFELYHAEGESYDHLFVWLPQREVLFPGDLFYRYFPMLSNPFKPPRPILSWASSLDRMRALRPKFLAPSHGEPICGAEAINAALANHAEAIRYVHDETIRRMNEGQLLDQICREVRLPPQLAQSPYLREEYGTVRWAVRGIFLQHAGWYSWRPKDLNPARAEVFARSLLQCCGSPRPLIQRARRALKTGDGQLALELTDLVLAARPRNRVARALNIRSLRALAAASENRVERNIYLSAARTALGEYYRLPSASRVG